MRKERVMKISVVWESDVVKASDLAVETWRWDGKMRVWPAIISGKFPNLEGDYIQFRPLQELSFEVSNFQAGYNEVHRIRLFLQAELRLSSEIRIDDTELAWYAYKLEETIQGAAQSLWASRRWIIDPRGWLPEIRRKLQKVVPSVK